MSSKEIAQKRKELEEDFKSKANIINGQLSDAKMNFDLQMKELQKECSHVWDNGEMALENFSHFSICVICRKKIQN